MPTRVLQPLNGSHLDIQLPDGISIGGARRRIAEFIGTSFGLVKLLSTSGDTLPEDAYPIDSLGDEVALIRLYPEPWKVAPFHCCFGTEFHHPVPQIDEKHIQVDTSEKLTVIATPASLTTWENFMNEFRSWKGYPPAVVDTSTRKEHVTDIIWGMTGGLGLAGLQPDDTEDKVAAILQKGGLEEHVQHRLEALLPLIRQRITYGNVIFPNAYEPVTKRRSFGNGADMEILSTASYFWFVARFDS